MNTIVITYSLYLLIALPLTVWVARSLFHNGRIFLIECFHGNEAIADSVNRLLVVGFYLINFGFVSLHLKMAREVQDARGVLEALSGKLGIVLLVLGAMHFLNLLIFAKMRERVTGKQTPPPLRPAGITPTRP